MSDPGDPKTGDAADQLRDLAAGLVRPLQELGLAQAEVAEALGKGPAGLVGPLQELGLAQAEVAEALGKGAARAVTATSAEGPGEFDEEQLRVALGWHALAWRGARSAGWTEKQLIRLGLVALGPLTSEVS